MNRRFITVLLIVATVLPLMSGCRWIREKLDMGWIVSDPDSDSPEWVVQQGIMAAVKARKDFGAGWADYQKLLHSSEYESPQAMKEWETLRLPAMSRKVECFLRTEEGEYAFEVKEIREEEETYVKVFVSCKTSDMPTPCNLKKDPKNGDAWRIVYGCLN